MTVPSDESLANNFGSNNLAHNPIPTSPIAGSAPMLVSEQPTPAPQRYVGRIGGLDIARALAIFGMYYAHVAPDIYGGGTAATVLDAIPDGRSSILFALLAGVSLAILTGRNVPYTGEDMRTARLRIFGRAATLIILAGPVVLLGTPVAIILAFYAAWFVAALPFASWGPRKLFILAGGTALLGPVTVQLFIWFATNLNMWSTGDANGFIVDVFFTGMYPGAVYMAYVFAGMGIGRLDITDRLTQLVLTLTGAALMIAGYGTSLILARFVGAPPEALDGSYIEGAEMESRWAWQDYPFPHVSGWVGIEPHTNTMFEAVGSGGFAIMVLGVCLLISPLAHNILSPVAAVGSMALTAYTSHIVVLAFIPDWVGEAGWAPVFWLVGGALVLCTLLKQFVRRGPLEWLMWKVSVKTAQVG
ncbi:MAG: DUF418 domain-containing protein [Ancrocorticia sp.]